MGFNLDQPLYVYTDTSIINILGIAERIAGIVGEGVWDVERSFFGSPCTTGWGMTK